MDAVSHTTHQAAFSARAGMGPGGEAPVVLVLDPDWDSRQILHVLLGARGYRVVEAVSLADARTLARRHPIALVISESRDALGHEGLAAEVRTEPALAAVPLIVCSSWLFPDDDTVEAVGALSVMTKPYDHHALLERVEQIVRASPGSDGPTGMTAHRGYTRSDHGDTGHTAAAPDRASYGHR